MARTAKTPEEHSLMLQDALERKRRRGERIVRLKDLSDRMNARSDRIIEVGAKINRVGTVFMWLFSVPVLGLVIGGPVGLIVGLFIGLVGAARNIEKHKEVK